MGNSIVLKSDGRILVNDAEVIGAEIVFVGKIENGKKADVVISFPADSLAIAHDVSFDEELDAIVTQSQEHGQMNPIQQKRKETGLSQQYIAECLGVTQGAVSQWEKGQAMPSADKLPQLAQILGCTVDELFARP